MAKVMSTPITLRCVFSKCTAPSQTFLRRNLHTPRNLLSGPDNAGVPIFRKHWKGMDKELHGQDPNFQSWEREEKREKRERKKKSVEEKREKMEMEKRREKEEKRKQNIDISKVLLFDLDNADVPIFRKHWKGMDKELHGQDPNFQSWERERKREKRERKEKSVEEKKGEVEKERKKEKKARAPHFESYSKEDLARLKKAYTPAQMAALEAGEAAVDTKDLTKQGALREDPFAFEYYDDFSKIHPIVDKAVKAPEENHDPKIRYKTEDETTEDFAKWIRDLPENPTRLDYMKFMDNLRLTVGKEEAERNPRSSLAPKIPKGLEALQNSGVKAGDADIDPATKRLMRQTGFSLDAVKKFRVKNLVVHRVVNQTRMGKIQSMYYLTIAGNGRGLLGIGEGKSTEPEDARRQAHFNAIRNVQPIPRYEDRTIFGDVKVKMGAVELELMTRPPGFGVRCQALIFEMCRCAGISDLAARVTRSRNPMNTIKATFQAFMSQRIPDEVARGLGKKLVDVRKVYYGGNI